MIPPQVWAALIGAVGVLAGVVVGAFLSAWYQRLAWIREQAARFRDERRRLFADFLTSAREWRATAQHPDTKLIRGSAASRSEHADGGTAAVRTIGLRSEIALTGQPATIRASWKLTKAHSLLAESRAKYPAGSIPDSLVEACRRAEIKFVQAARDELGTPVPETELDGAFRNAVNDSAELID